MKAVFHKNFELINIIPHYIIPTKTFLKILILIKCLDLSDILLLQTSEYCKDHAIFCRHRVECMQWQCVIHRTNHACWVQSIWCLADMIKCILHFDMLEKMCWVSSRMNLTSLSKLANVKLTDYATMPRRAWMWFRQRKVKAWLFFSKNERSTLKVLTISKRWIDSN